MRTLAVLALSCAVAACAGAEPRPSSGGSVRTPVHIDAGEGGSYDLDLYRDDATITARMDASVDRVWNHLPAVYEEIGIGAGDLSRFNPGTHEIGISNKRLSRLGGRRLSTYLDCGHSYGGDKADRGQTQVTLTSWLEPTDEGTAIHTSLQATSRDIGTSATPATCVSRGTLEEEILKRLMLRLAQDEL